MNPIAQSIGGMGVAGMAAPKNTAAMEVMDFANRLNSRADKVSSSVAEKLARYSIQVPPSNETATPITHMPEYFDLLRGHLMQIENALNSITASLERAEL